MRNRLDRSSAHPAHRPLPLHERLRVLGWLRAPLRRALFHFLRKLAATDDAKVIQAASLGDLLAWRPEALPKELVSSPPPYPGLGQAYPQNGPAFRDDIILITARFRSGSTLLWNLFRNLDGYTAYYEPFNERRWFDPHMRGSRMDPTHRKAEEYWREYEGLEVLGAYYRESWTEQNLYMDAASWDPGMKRYVELLIERAPGRPVLQFNRIDFRLPWFHHHFPRAQLLHLYRHPRDQWLSALGDPRAFPRDGTMADFARHDHFYLRRWARDLKYRFPFLDETLVEHPYRLFYFLWRLSFLYGRHDAHHSLAYEDLVQDPDVCLADLFRRLNIAHADLDRLKRLIEKPALGKWRTYADEAWFQSHEVACESILEEFFSGSPPSSPDKVTR